MPVIHALSNDFIQILIDAGIIPENCYRVVIDAKANDLVHIHYEVDGTDKLLRVLPAAAKGVEIIDG